MASFGEIVRNNAAESRKQNTNALYNKFRKKLLVISDKGVQIATCVIYDESVQHPPHRHFGMRTQFDTIDLGQFFRLLKNDNIYYYLRPRSYDLYVTIDITL